MHSSGSITSMFGPSRKQSTGQTSTQSVYLHFTQDSVTTYVMDEDLVSRETMLEGTGILSDPPLPAQPTLLPRPVIWSKIVPSIAPGSPRTPFSRANTQRRSSEAQ